MRKFFALIGLLAIMTSGGYGQDKNGPLSGGTGRTAALGGGPSNPYIRDYTDVFINPAYAAQYNSLLYSDIGYGFTGFTATGQYVGYTMSMSDLAIGFAVGRREGPMFPEQAYGTGTYASSDYMKPPLDAWLGGRGPTETPVAPIQVYAAFKLGDLSLGAGVYRSSWSREENGTPAAGAITIRWLTRNSQTGVKAGVLVDLTRTMMLDASFLLRFNGSMGELSQGVLPPVNPNFIKYDASGTEIGINSRMVIKLTNKVHVIPTARFKSFGYKPEDTNNLTPPPAVVNTTPNDYGRTDLEFGVGVHNAFENGFVVAGVSFQQIRLRHDVTTIVAGALQTTKNTQTQTDLPKINFGAEIELLDWLVGRFGYFKRFTSTSDKTEPATTATTESTISSEAAFVPTLGLTAAQQQLSVGLGIRVSRVSIDGYVSERLLAAGPYILSGNAQDLFGVLSMSFRF